MNTSEKTIIEQFHKLYYDRSDKTWADTRWLGTKALKCPLDLWIYQEIIYEQKPDIIIECGTGYGGSALFLASLCDLVNTGQIIAIDVNFLEELPKHNRITYLTGSSISKKIGDQVKKLVNGKEKVMVILDSDHRKEHVLQELWIYGELVTPGCYMIVEDTNINGHPVYPDLGPFGPGPMEAIEEFLKTNEDFIIDSSKEKFYLTFSPKGYLKKIAASDIPHGKKNKRLPGSTLGNDITRLSHLVNVAEYYFNAENYAFCIEKFQEALNYADGGFTHRILIKLAVAYSKNNMPGEAEKTINKVLATHPEHIEAIYTLGSICKEHNNYATALKLFNKVVDTETTQKDVFWAGAHFHRGEILTKLSKPSQAAEEFKLCIRYNPHHNAAMMYIKKYGFSALSG